MEEFFQNIDLGRLIAALVIVLVAGILYKLVSWSIGRRLKKRGKNRQRDTYFVMLSNIFRYAYLAIVAMIIMQLYGVNISAMVAGLGIFSAVAGLALQNTLKDIIRGFSLISEDYYKIGDFVHIGEHAGTVVHLGIRSTKIRNALTGDIITIANSEINQVRTSAKLINLDVPLAYELSLSQAEEIIEEIIARARVEIANIEEIEYRGVSELAEYAVKYRVYIACKDTRVQVKRDFHRVILQVLETHKMSVPYPQMDVHTKK